MVPNTGWYMQIVMSTLVLFRFVPVWCKCNSNLSESLVLFLNVLLFEWFTYSLETVKIQSMVNEEIKSK